MKNDFFYIILALFCFAWALSCKKEQPEQPVVIQAFRCDSLHNQCLNGGQCDNGECNCPPHFTGKRCETEIIPRKMVINKIVVESFQCKSMGINAIAYMILLRQNHWADEDGDTIWKSAEILNNSDKLVFNVSPPAVIPWDSAMHPSDLDHEGDHVAKLYMKSAPYPRFCSSYILSFKTGSPDTIKFSQTNTYLWGFGGSDSIAGYLDVDYIW